MTTIAFDGKTLAADTQATGQYLLQRPARKVRSHGAVAWAVAGYEANIETFSDWIKNGRPEQKPQLAGADDFCALVIEEGHCVSYQTGGLVRLKAGTPAAIGSGAEIAMGAMMAGADARQAVRIAIKLDPYTGGRVDAIDIESLTSSKHHVANPDAAGVPAGKHAKPRRRRG